MRRLVPATLTAALAAALAGCVTADSERTHEPAEVGHTSTDARPDGGTEPAADGAPRAGGDRDDARPAEERAEPAEPDAEPAGDGKRPPAEPAVPSEREAATPSRPSGEHAPDPAPAPEP
ncbi:hypothetical protein E1265_33360, partial [Streptomyces sp. 8K308]